MTQKDLFEFAPKVTPVLLTETAKPKTTFSFLEQTCFTLRLDQVLAGSMALMVGMAVVYGLGVESGRRMERRTPAAKPVSAAAAPVPAREVSVPAVEIKGRQASGTLMTSQVTSAMISMESSMHQSEVIVTQSKTRSSEKPKGAYTIQLATYKEPAIAKKRIETLTAQGLNGFLVPSGNYYLVCVNGFEKRQQASLSLTRLKARGIVPKDAYVRMIPA